MWSEKKSGGRDVGERGLAAKAPLQSLSKLTQGKWTWGQSFSQPHPTSCCESHKCDLKRPASVLQVLGLHRHAAGIFFQARRIHTATRTTERTPLIQEGGGSC